MDHLAAQEAPGTGGIVLRAILNVIWLPHRAGGSALRRATPGG
jgi:hypothetical protein